MRHKYNCQRKKKVKFIIFCREGVFNLLFFQVEKRLLKKVLLVVKGLNCHQFLQEGEALKLESKTLLWERKGQEGKGVKLKMQGREQKGEKGRGST